MASGSHSLTEISKVSHSSASTSRHQLRTKQNPLNADRTTWGHTLSPLKRKKSSDSASTGTAVTAPEEERVDSVSRIAGSLIARPRSRIRVEEQLDIRPPKSDTVRQPFHSRYPDTISDKLQRKTFLIQSASGDHRRKDKGKNLDCPGSSTPASQYSTGLVDGGGDRRHNEHIDKVTYTGPLAYAEFERLRRDAEIWKKAANDYKKTAKKHTKKIEELKAQVAAESLAKKEQEMQVQTLKAKSEKKDELIAAIEHSISCQICLDLIDKPYALSPCGHVLCLSCLQEWFRKAPPSAGDSDSDPDTFQDDPAYILNRTKSCPCCRTVIIQRPIPIFVVKAVASAIAKHKTATEASNVPCGRSPTPDAEDPWKGLFPVSDDEVEGILEESSDEDEVYGRAIGWAMQGLGLHAGMPSQHLLRSLEHDDSDSGSEGYEDDEDDDGVDDDSLDDEASDVYDNVYVAAQWEPPSVSIDPEDHMLQNHGIDNATLRMLRRGCTVDMIRMFKMSYLHSRGLVAHLPSLDELSTFPSLDPDISPATSNRIFLGWNVKLDEADYAGEVYMQGVLHDLKENPERWMWADRANVNGAYDVKPLIKADEVEDYDTTDTEVWLDALEPAFF